MIKLATLALGATLGAAALGISAPASAGVAIGIGIPLPPVPAVTFAPPAYAPNSLYYGYPYVVAGVPYGWGYWHPHAWVRPGFVAHAPFPARGYHFARR